MKRSRLFALLLVCMLSTLVYAAGENKEKAIVMVAYEQGWLDSNGTLALKNNTEGTVVSVSYQLTYLDMSGNPLDYKNFTSDVVIAPSKTKKVDIPAYEHSRNYSYYKSEAVPGTPHRFKLSFKLLDYETKGKEVSKVSSMDDADDDKEETYEEDYGVEKKSGWLSIGEETLAIYVGIFAVGFFIGLYVLVYTMAKRRNRDGLGWLIVSFFLSPLPTIIILLCVGNANKNRDL